MLRALTASLIVIGMSQSVWAQIFIDLTHPFDKQTIYWPTEKGFELQVRADGFTDRGYFYAANRFCTPEHGGTHIDAPYHFAEHGETVDQIPLSRLLGEAVMVDVTAQCAVDRDYLVTVEDFKKWEEDNRDSLSNKIVLLNTGYAKYWPDREKYLGTSATGEAAVTELHFPGLDPAAATWLATRREIKVVGLDTASIDHGPSRDFGSHVNLFKHNVPALENVAALDNLPPKGFYVAALPMKIAGGSGGPCRIVAVLKE